MNDKNDNNIDANLNENKRKNRKKHRIKNQILSYLCVIIIVVILGLALYKGVLILSKVIKEQGEPIDEVISQNMVEATPEPEENTGAIVTPDFDAIDEALSETESDNSVSDDAANDNSVELAEARVYVDSLTTEQKVANLFVVTPESITNVDVATVALEGTKNALEKYAVGGIIYSSSNILGADEFKTMISNTKGYYNELYGINLWTFAREEGAINTIAGSKANVVKTETAEDIGNTGDNGNAYAAYVTIANNLSEYNINVDLGPVCSYKENEQSYLGNRVFSSDSDITASMVSKAVDGLNEKDIVSCLTAFPGEGDITTDPVNGAVSTEKSLDDMKETNFAPFVSGIDGGASMVMMSHIIANNATGEDVPCSMSSVMINDVLRGELGFTGVVITDDMSKKAITDKYSSGEAAVNAINAGCDMVLNPKNFEESYNAVLEAVNNGTISEERLDEALMHIYSVKFK